MDRYRLVDAGFWDKDGNYIPDYTVIDITKEKLEQDGEEKDN